jgi:TonB-linked SusC/RagA family outer membrane protein
MKIYHLKFYKQLCLFVACLFISGFQVLQAQQVSVSGKIVDSSGGFIPGVNILIKGTSIGTISNMEGRYSFEVSKGDVLVFSFVGFNSQEVKVANQSVINITMTESVNVVDDVIVMAYGTTNREALTGSASVVKAEDLEKINNSSITKSLEGLSPGVQVFNTDGRPGAEATILVRGITSINADNTPLYIVDGAPYEGALNQIASSDIESITVLKDAAANALYGSRASGGVIVITTKRGKDADGKINFRAKWGVTDFAVDLPTSASPGKTYEYFWKGLYQGQLQNGFADDESREYATSNLVGNFFPQFNAEQRAATGRIYYNCYDTDTPVGTDGLIKSDANYIWPEENFNWYDALFDKGFNQEYSLDFSGRAGDKLQYFFSINHLEDGGIYTTQEFERTTARLNLTAQVKDWIKVGGNFSYSHSFQNDANAYVRFYRTMPSVNGVYEWDYINNDYFYDSYDNKIPDDAFDPDKNQTRLAWLWWVQQQQGEYNNDYGWSFTGLFRDAINISDYIELELAKGLKFKTMVSLNLNSSSRTWFSSITEASSTNGSTTQSQSKDYSLTWNNLLTYNKSFGVHNFSILAGHELFSQQWNSLSANATGFAMDGLYVLDAATETVSSGGSVDEYKLVSYFGRLEYNYDNTYYIGASVRQDGSSRFAPDTRWGTFWSGSFSWRLTKEAFIQDIEWLDELKLKASIGSVGNDKVGLYAYQGLFSAYADLDNTGYLMSTLATPDLKWEKNIQTNVGFDFRLLNRLNGSIEYFVKDSKDLLFEVPLAPSSGFDGIDQNIGNLANKGFEAFLNYSVLKNKRVTWDISVSATTLKNEITKLPDGWNEIQGNYYRGIGNSLYEFYAPVWAGVNDEGANTWYLYEFETDGDGEFIRNSHGEKTVLSKTTTTEYSDVNNTTQRRIVGSALPKVYGSITNSLFWKGFDFSAMFYYSLGSDMYDNYFAESTTWRPKFAVTENWDKYCWDLNGNDPDSRMPRLSEQDYEDGNTGVYSTQYIFNNNYVRLRNLTIGYTIPKSLCQKVKMESLRLYVSGDNLLTFGSAVKRGTDPGVGLTGLSNNSSGNTSSRKFMNVGINLTF